MIHTLLTHKVKIITVVLFIVLFNSVLGGGGWGEWRRIREGRLGKDYGRYGHDYYERGENLKNLEGGRWGIDLPVGGVGKDQGGEVWESLWSQWA